MLHYLIVLSLFVLPAAAQDMPPGEGQTIATEADRYLRGDGVIQDDAKALSLYDEAAQMGVARAMYMLGQMYADGRGVERDAAKAAEHYRDAVARSYAPAMTALGIAYAEGRGVRAEPATARSLLMRAADAGDREARDYLQRHNLRP